MTALVSICLPNLNTLPYLQERFDSILKQTFEDWELFVFDSHSDDGSWEFIKQVARGDDRIRISQGPREGIYPAWNECLQQTKGEYAYIATSDDSMSYDFLEKMVQALEVHRQCELAICPLVIVDKNGTRSPMSAWLDWSIFADGIGGMAEQPHIRSAPYDGLLQLTGRNSIVSITQVLIRRSLFSKIGNFGNRWGSVSDFNWEMKAGLVANIVHVPETWATWRAHPSQATAGVNFDSHEHMMKIEEMIEDAMSTCQNQIPVAVVNILNSSLLRRAKAMRRYYTSLRRLRGNAVRRRLFQVIQLFTGSMDVRKEIVGRFLGRPKWTEETPMDIRLLLESLSIHPLTLCSSMFNSEMGLLDDSVRRGKRL